MKQKTEIKNLQELITWIEDNDCCVFDKDEDTFIVKAPNNATWQIQFNKDDKIDDIISKTIEQFEEFDADDEFTKLWSADFAKHNGFTPLQFITMLKEDEESFWELAYKLRDILE